MCSCPRVLWKTEFVNDKIGYLAKAISKPSVEGAAWLLLNSHSKMREERNGLKLLIKRETEIKSLENSQPIHMAKNEKAYSDENTNKRDQGML